MSYDLLLVIVSFTLVGIVIRYVIERRNRNFRRLMQADLNKPRFTNPDTKPELAQFLTRLIPDDFRNDSLVHRNGKFYGASSGKEVITLRLPAERHDEAVAAGGERTDRREWIKFRYDWGNPTPGTVDQETMERWIFAARDYVDAAK
jgi:hypothetical protein